MKTTYPKPRISRTFPSRPPRNVLKPPSRQIALRTDYITDTKTRLLVRPEGDAQSAVAYNIVTEEDGISQFTVTGWKFYSDRSCREFRDASGLPLFELRRDWFALRRGGFWSVTLPGGGIGYNNNNAGGAGGAGGGALATGTPRIRSLSSSPFGNFSITIENNAAAVDSKREEDKKLTLEIQRHGNALASFDVVDGGDRKVAELRQSIHHNERLPLISSQSGYRPVLDVVVTPGVDVSLIAIIAVIASDSVWSSNV